MAHGAFWRWCTTGGAALLLVPGFPSAARAGAQAPGSSADVFASVLRRWTFDACAQGTVIARPEPVRGDVVCVSGVATWGRTSSDGLWRMLLAVRETGHPDLLLGPFLDVGNSDARFTYADPDSPCGSRCQGYDLVMGEDAPPGIRRLSVSLPSILVGEEGVSPESIRLTRVSLLYVYQPFGGGTGEWGVVVDATPTLVPEPATLALVAAGLGALGTVRRTTRTRAGGPGA